MSYADTLRQNIGLTVDMVQSVHNNAPGIADDVGLLLERAVSLPETKTILEIGSGTSTAILAKSALVHGKHFVSFDESQTYRDITANTLLLLGLSCDLRYLPPEATHGRTPIDIDFIPDLLFLDGGGREAILQINPFRQTRTIIIDDINFDGPTKHLFASWGRKNFYIYNPTGRPDRHEYINFLPENFDIPNWVQSWGGGNP